LWVLEEESLTEVLVHGVGVLSPGLEVSLVCGELLLEGLDVGGVFVEEDLLIGVVVSIRCLASAIGSSPSETSLINMTGNIQCRKQP
jgi:hypothetical protein